MGRINSEKQTVKQMLEIYCRHHHGTTSALCHDCTTLLEYSHKRLTACKFGDQKTTCRLCPIHCYKPDMREQMRQVMRFAGPRMLFHHPIAALRHLWQEFCKG